MKKLRSFTMALILVLIMAAPVSASTSKYTWSEKAAPNYVKVVGKAKVSGKPKKGVIKYSGLDSLGRSKRVVGNITYKMVKESAGWREEITKDPSGWPTVNPIKTIKLYNGRKYKGYFWNRSHLIADSLGGRARKDNLITGTRMQNVGANDGNGGMAYTERKAVAWLNNHHKGNVYYSAKPVYKDNELIPRSVIVDIKTSDKKINERVIVYNAAKGYTINYRTASSKKASASKQATQSSMVYITATGSKYHSTKNCRGLSRANEITKTTLSQAKNMGLEPCKLCH